LNEVDNIYRNSPLLWGITYNNTTMVKSIIDYANKNNIILKLNENNYDKLDTLLLTILKNNIDIFKLIIDYINKNDIILKLSENMIEKFISRNTPTFIKSVTEIDEEIIKLLKKNKDEHKIIIIYSYESILLERFNSLTEEIVTIMIMKIFKILLWHNKW